MGAFDIFVQIVQIGLVAGTVFVIVFKTNLLSELE